MYDFWESCVDLQKRRLRRGSEPIRSFIKQNIHWPALDLESTMISSFNKSQRFSYDLYEFPAKSIRQANTAFFIISKEQTKEGGEILAINSLSGGITLDTQSYTNDKGDKLKFFKNFIKNTLIELKKDETVNGERNDYVDVDDDFKSNYLVFDEKIEKEVKNIVAVEKRLAEIKQRGKDTNSAKSIITLRELNEFTNTNLKKLAINWITLFKEILGPENTIKNLGKLKVSVDSVSTLRDIVEYMNQLYRKVKPKTKGEIITGGRDMYRSYSAWRSIGNLMSDVDGKLSQNLEIFEEETKAKSTVINNDSQRLRQCKYYLETYYTYVLGFLYKNQNDGTDVEKARVLVEQIRNTVKMEVERVDYKTPEYLNNFAIPKINNLKLSIGYPEFFDREGETADLLNEIHGKLKIRPKTYFENMFKLKDFHFQQKIVGLVQKQPNLIGKLEQGLDILNGSWIYDTTKTPKIEITGTELVYQPETNQLYVPLAYLQNPNFYSSNKIPDAVLYSSVGYEIARKILGSVISPEGFKWDHHGSISKWTGGDFFKNYRAARGKVGESMKTYFGEVRYSGLQSSRNQGGLRKTGLDVLLNSVAIDAASSAMGINFGRGNDVEELLLASFTDDENWPLEGGLRQDLKMVNH